MQHLQKTGVYRLSPNADRALLTIALDSQLHYSCRKARFTGDGTSTTCPVGVRPPVSRSILKTTMLLDNWFSASRYLPLGSMAKCRGSFPPVGTCATNVSVPFAGSIAKIAMLSCPRLEAYRNFPLGCTAISAASFRPANPFGSMDIVCTARYVSCASFAKTVTVDCISPSTYMNLPPAPNAACRGPAPGFSVAEKGSAAAVLSAVAFKGCRAPGVSEPLVASNL